VLRGKGKEESEEREVRREERSDENRGSYTGTVSRGQ
jgi:hypothetical protein